MKSLMNACTSARARRNTPPVPPHEPFRPNEVTPATTMLSPRKFGPPESPKQVPPLAALFDSSNEKGPVNPVFFWINHGLATIRIFCETIWAGLIRCTPYPTEVKPVFTPTGNASSELTVGSVPY